jgi:predicted nucleic acid-binding protein
MLTLDANIWIAAYDPGDRFHTQSTTFLSTVTHRHLELHGPAFLLVEAVCALARRARSPVAGERALEQLRWHPTLVLHPINDQLLVMAAQLGAGQLLRGADALYVATAAMLNAPLVSWDEELIRRAGAISPTDWLALQS